MNFKIYKKEAQQTKSGFCLKNSNEHTSGKSNVGKDNIRSGKGHSLNHS